MAGRTTSGEQRSEEIFLLPRQESRSRERRESRMFLVDGQLCWADREQAGGKRNSSMGLLFGSSMNLPAISLSHSLDSSGGGSSASEAISYRMKWCRESIDQLKRQTWPMDKKLQVLRASKLFIKQHQGESKQSKQARDVLASSGAILDRYWRHFRRELANFLVIITPWEMRIKKIESHFGSVVASYFTFLRWIFWLNLANSLVMVVFVMVPELIENAPDLTGMRKGGLGMEPVGGMASSVEFNPTLGELWEFEGFLKFSPIFYGYYSNQELGKSGFWRNPLAFLLSAMLTYLFCFFCISRKLSQNTKLSRTGSKDDEYTFCWTVFVGWDFMIGNAETAYNKTSSLIMNLKEGILEEKEQTKDRDWRLIIRRVFANLLTMMLIVASAYVVTLAVQRSENLPEDASLLQKNELQLVMSGIQFMFPPLFDVIGIIEKYHPRKALSWQLGRILFLDFLNFYTLMFSLFGTVDQMGQSLNEAARNITTLRSNTTNYQHLFTTTESQPRPSTSSTVEATTEQTLTSTKPAAWSTEDGTAAQTTPSASSAAGSLLTSYLLASSIIMPSQPTAYGSQLVAIGSVQQTTSSRLTADSSTIQILAVTTELLTTEQDYPDLGEALAKANEERDESDEALLGERQLKSRQLELRLHSKQPAHMPPLRDPYRKATAKPSPGWPYGEPPDHQDDPLDDEGRREEPLEGRLPATSATSSRPPIGSRIVAIGGTVARQRDQLTSSAEPNVLESTTSTVTTSITETPTQPAPSTERLLPVQTTAQPQKVYATETSSLDSMGQVAELTVEPIVIVTSAPISLDLANQSEGARQVDVASLKSSKSPNLTTDEHQTDCLEMPHFRHQEILALNDTFKDKLKSLCWETMFGQEMVKIVVMDLVMTVISAVSFEFMRAFFVRYCNKFFFWDLERGFPGYQDFKIAENVLHLVNNQSTVWMGMFFAPGLPAINTVKLVVLMYVRSWAVLTCNIPHETVFKVSKSNNFYYWILLINLLICILPVAYAVTWIKPSWHCGPFAGQCRMYLVATKTLKNLLPPEANTVFRYITSPGAVIPILISLILIIYYLASTVSSSKEANKELKAQIKKEKDQEAAVPEITNTMVVDAQPVAAASALAQPPKGAAKRIETRLEQPSQAMPQQSTQPKSLLMPLGS